MKKLVFINACIREEESGTLRLATPLLMALRKVYEVTEISLAHAALSPVTAELFHERGTRGISEYDAQMGRLVSNKLKMKTMSDEKKKSRFALFSDLSLLVIAPLRIYDVVGELLAKDTFSQNDLITVVCIWVMVKGRK